jgi:hypothetical protein
MTSPTQQGRADDSQGRSKQEDKWMKENNAEIRKLLDLFFQSISAAVIDPHGTLRFPQAPTRTAGRPAKRWTQ